MKLFETDWGAFLARVKEWESIPPEVRARLLAVKSAESVPGDRFGAALDSLIEKDVLRPVQNGGRVRLHDDFREASRLLRAMHRSRVFRDPRRLVLEEYLREHFTVDAMRQMVDGHAYRGRYPHNPRADLAARVETVGHVRGFLEAKEPHSWGGSIEVQHRVAGPSGWHTREWQQVPLFPDDETPRDLKALLRRLSKEPGPVRLSDLPRGMPRISRARLGSAIQAGLGSVLVLAGLDESLAPVIGLWPPVLAHLRRPPPPPIEVVEPETVHAQAWAIDDLVQVLVRVAEPVRVTTQGKLFARSRRELEALLAPLPPWLLEARDGLPAPDPAARLDTALGRGIEHGLCRVEGERGRDLSLGVTGEGMAWLELGPAERLGVLLRPLRPRAPGDEPAPTDDLPGDLDPDFDDWIPRPFSSPARRRGPAPDDDEEARLFSEVLGSLDVGGPVAARAFFRHHVEEANPFLGDSPPSRRLYAYGLHGDLPVEQAEQLWFDELREYLGHELVPLGAVQAGRTEEGALTLELTEVGRYVLGTTDELVLDAPAPDSGPPARIGSDFEVVFLSPDPALEAAFGLFAERLGTGVGRLFRITKESVLSAANAGTSPDDVLATLRRASAGPLPGNVEHEVKAWFALHRRLSIEAVQIIRCPDAETADRVEAAAGKRVERLSKTVVLLPEPKKAADLQRVCKKAGIFLVKEVAKPRSRERRPSRW